MEINFKIEMILYKRRNMMDSYEEMERKIDIFCVIFAISFCVVYWSIMYVTIAQN